MRLVTRVFLRLYELQVHFYERHSSYKAKQRSIERLNRRVRLQFTEKMDSFLHLGTDLP